jgi:hypothetical protein
MSRACIVALLLIVSLGASASVCIVGYGNSSLKSCKHLKSDQGCARKSPNAGTAQCGSLLKAPPSNCSIRSLAQFHLFVFPKLEAGITLLVLPESVSIPPGSVPRVTSIGSPETDRGPPLS